MPTKPSPAADGPKGVETAAQLARPADVDAVLVERSRGGDEGAFDEIVRRHKRFIYLVARRLLGSHEDADEAAQVAFIRAWRALDRFRGEAALRTWLTRIVLNVAKSMRSAQEPEEGIEACDRLADPGEGSDERMRRKQARQRVRRAVDGLPPRQREVVVLKVFSEMTHREVAASMGLSEGSVKAHLHQAVSNLRRIMAASGRADR